MPLRLAITTKNAVITTVVGLLDAGAGSGTIDIYSGAQPATVEDTATGDLLATIILEDPSFTVNAGEGAGDADPVLAVATGVAGWFRALDSTGGRVLDGEVSDMAGSGQLKLVDVNITSGAPVDIASLSMTA